MAAATDSAPLDCAVLPAPSIVTKPVLSVIIVNYCQWRNTAKLVGQLRQSHATRAGEAEIIIVDNDSPPDRLRKRLSKLPGVRIRRFGRNVGFARAVNAGARSGLGDWILLLNPDMSATPGLLDDADRLIAEHSQVDSRVGVVGLGVRDSNGSPQPSFGRWPTLGRILFGLFQPRANRRCQSAANAPAEVSWATGCPLLIRRECLKDVRGFDRKFFLYYEDVDFCKRASERDWKIRYEPGVSLTHHSPLHSRKVPATLRLVSRHALLQYAKSHWPRWQTTLLGSIMKVEATFRQAVAWWRRRPIDVSWHARTRRMIGDMMAGRDAAVRTCLRAAAERLAPIAAAQDDQAG